jgi:hypothetical protein
MSEFCQHEMSHVNQLRSSSSSSHAATAAEVVEEEVVDQEDDAVQFSVIESTSSTVLKGSCVLLNQRPCSHRNALSLL